MAKRELVAFIRERRAYLAEQELLIETVVNNGNNAIAQLTLEADTLQAQILQLMRQKIQLERERDEVLFLIVTSQVNI